MYSTKKEITEEYIVKRINILKCGAQRTLEKKNAACRRGI